MWEISTECFLLKLLVLYAFDLNYDLFEHLEPRKGFTIARYRGVRFDDVRMAVRTGCMICKILQKGIEVFYGEISLDVGKALSPSSGYERKYSQLRVLERHPGKSLMASLMAKRGINSD
jgi:hypothetical protein